jgi:hypothetical protein
MADGRAIVACGSAFFNVTVRMAALRKPPDKANGGIRRLILASINYITCAMCGSLMHVSLDDANKAPGSFRRSLWWSIRGAPVIDCSITIERCIGVL